MLKPISLSPSSGPSVKCSSASASFPGGLPLSFGVILIVIVAVPSWRQAHRRRASRVPACPRGRVAGRPGVEGVYGRRCTLGGDGGVWSGRRTPTRVASGAEEEDLGERQ